MPVQHPSQPSRRDCHRRCRDRWRHQRQQRHRKATADPATSIFLQLLALVLLVFGRAPVTPPPLPAARPRPAVRRPPDDRTPEAIERENGEGSYLLPPCRDSRRYGRYKAVPSYRRLVRDAQRPAARRESLDVLRQRLRLPPEAGGWLDGLERDGELAALLPRVQLGMTDTDCEAALLLAAVQWLEARKDPELLPPTPPRPDDDDGDGGDDHPPPPGGTKGPP